MKKITNSYGRRATEIYFVTKKDKIREGPYVVEEKRGGTLISGYYSAGEKDSTWTYYSSWNHIVISKHFYKRGIKTGIWEFYFK